jgi:hypothetical protein
MRKPTIVVSTRDPTLRPTLDAIKENIEIITGQRRNGIHPLPPTASLEDVIAKVNQIIDRLD